MCQLSSLDLPVVPMLGSFHHHSLESGFPVTAPGCGILGTLHSAFLPSSREYFLLVACDWHGDNTCLWVNMTGVWSKWFLSDFPTTRELMKDLERETRTHWRITSILVVTRGWIESIDRMFCLEGGLEEWPEGAAFSGAAKSCSPVNKFQKESFLLLETLHLPPSSYSPETWVWSCCVWEYPCQIFC